MAILTRAALVAGLLLSSAGCELPSTMIDVTDRRIAVHAVLIAGSDTVSVLVTRPSLTAGQWWDTGTLPVSNAQVRLIHGADTIALSGTRACIRYTPGPGPGCYSAVVPGGVRAGATYELLVNVPGEEPIHGSTRVPLAPQIVEPGAAADPPLLRMRDPTLSSTPLTARWSGAAPAARTELRFVADRSDCFAIIARPGRNAASDHIAMIGSDTATVTAVAVQCEQAPADRYSAQFVVTVYDESYTRYLERLGESTIVHRSAGITGAHGVFGAAANSAVPVVLSAQ